MDKHFYNEASAKKLGWEPSWFGESILMMDIKLAGTPSIFECYPLRNGGIRMIEDRKTVKCDSFISLGAQEFYMDSLIIKLNYDYSISASTGAIALKRKTGDR